MCAIILTYSFKDYIWSTKILSKHFFVSAYVSVISLIINDGYYVHVQCFNFYEQIDFILYRKIQKVNT